MSIFDPFTAGASVVATFSKGVALGAYISITQQRFERRRERERQAFARKVARIVDGLDEKGETHRRGQ